LTKRRGGLGRGREPEHCGAAGHGHRVPGPERRREVDYHAADPGAGRPHQRVGDREVAMSDLDDFVLRPTPA